MPSEIRKASGIKYRIGDQGEVLFETEEDQEIYDSRDYWCVCTDRGDMISMMETGKDSVFAEDILEGLKDDPRGDLNCYKIDFIEYEEARREMRKAQLDSSPSIPDEGITGKKYIAPKDSKYLEGKRDIQARTRGEKVQKKIEGAWKELPPRKIADPFE